MSNYEADISFLVGEIKGRLSALELAQESLSSALSGRMDKIELDVHQLELLRGQLQLVLSLLKMLSISLPGLGAIVGKLMIDASNGGQ